MTATDRFACHTDVFRCWTEDYVSNLSSHQNERRREAVRVFSRDQQRTVMSPIVIKKCHLHGWRAAVMQQTPYGGAHASCMSKVT